MVRGSAHKSLRASKCAGRTTWLRPEVSWSGEVLYDSGFVFN